MPRLPPEVVGDAYTSDHAWTVLEELADIGNRMAGQEGEVAGAEAVKAAFDRAGLDEIEIDEFEIPGWWRGSSALSLPGRDEVHDGTHEVIALPGTPEAEVTTGLVDVGYGLPDDFEEADLDGKICMASSDTPGDFGRWIHRGEKYSRAVDQGAIGFIFRNHIEGSLPPTGSIGSDGPGEIPAVGVSKELGERIARYADGGELETRLSIECRNGEATSRNIEGVLGPDTEREILVTAHVDAHDIAEGAGDNGVGTALVCETARLLSKVGDELDTRIRFLVFGAEEIGLCGSSHWARTRDHDTVKCVINSDAIGGSRTLQVDTHTFPAIGEAFEGASDDLGVPIEVGEDISPHSDHWPFVQEGIPGAMVRSKSESSDRGWGHTHGDTLDKLDRRDIRDLAIGLAASVRNIADADVKIEHKEPREIGEAVDPGEKEGMQATGGWPFEDVDYSR